MASSFDWGLFEGETSDVAWRFFLGGGSRRLLQMPKPHSDSVKVNAWRPTFDKPLQTHRLGAMSDRAIDFKRCARSRIDTP